MKPNRTCLNKLQKGVANSIPESGFELEQGRA